MITTTLGNIVKCEPVMSKLAQEKRNVATAYKLAKLARELQKEYDLFNSAKRVLITHYAEKDAQGNPKMLDTMNYIIAKDDEEVFLREYNDLMSMQIELNAEPLEIEELQNDELSAQEINSIMDFIKEKSPA